jgi:hypothetical protein
LPLLRTFSVLRVSKQMEKSQRISGIFLVVVFSVLASGGCSARSTKDSGHSSTYLESRKSYSTVLKTRGPAPDWHSERAPTGVTEVSYQSGELTLKAWLAMPIVNLPKQGLPGLGRRSEKTLRKNNGKRYSGECPFPFSASLQWLCPSTREEEEVI